METKKYGLRKILSQSLDQVNSYKEPELRAIVKMMNTEVAKRASRLERFEQETKYFEDGELTGGSTSPALYRLRNAGGTKESENFQKLRNDFKRAYKFLTDPTSKITTWKQIRKELKDKFIEYTGIDTHNYKWIDKFFNVYNKYQELPEDGYSSMVYSFGSEQTFRDAAQIYQQILDKGYYKLLTDRNNRILEVGEDATIEEVFLTAMEDLYRYKSRN